MLWIATLISLTMVAMRWFMDVPRTGWGIGRVKALSCDITLFAGRALGAKYMLRLELGRRVCFHVGGW